ncbi:MAG: glycosyltransferase family 1 protein, partial [Cyanobacteriota bacterium]|nr:glycosyltransferase family 1 protein [Cyanobacteriota bacterium]
HTQILHRDRFPYPASELLCWWSGPPREEKGWKVIKSLVETPSHLCENICILAAQSSQFIPTRRGVKIQLVEDSLSREEYVKWMNTCNFVLIPYNSEAYRERTSGIFTECIIAGKIPLVTPDTWMARELSKYELQALVLNWENPIAVFQAIADLPKNTEIASKLAQMQNNYNQYHSLGNYARTLDAVWTKASTQP